MNDIKRMLFLHLLDTGALRFGEFTLKSGRKAPYFVNLATAMEDGMSAWRTANCYAEVLIRGQKPLPNFLFGPAYKGIPLAALVARELATSEMVSVRWGHDRKETKQHGDSSERTMVGRLANGDIVAVIDDVITTGQTKLDSIRVIEREARRLDLDGVTVTSVVVAVDRQERDDRGLSPSEFLAERGVNLIPIVTVTEIFDCLRDDEGVRQKYGIVQWMIDAFDRYFEEWGAT